MARNKVVYGGETLIDLTADTVTANTLLQGSIAHDKSGEQISGAVQFITYYTGTTEPSATLGQNGDIYLKTV